MARKLGLASIAVSTLVLSLTALASQPLTFEVNRGQSAAPVQFLARGGQGTVFLTPAEAVITRGARVPRKKRGEAIGAESQPAVLRLSLHGANPSPVLQAEGELAGRVNYYLGNDPSRWIEGVPICSKVRYMSVYPGVDMVFYGSAKQLEYDFILAPGARPERITLRFRDLGGATLRPRLNSDGDLVLKTPTGGFAQQAPRAWQERGVERIPVASAYLLKGRGRVGFRLGPYDHSLPLIIDPTLLHSTYLGGSSSDSANGVAMDSLGNAVVTGTTSSANFPGTIISPSYGISDVFVAKYGPYGASLIFCSIFGGASADQGRAVAVDANGSIYVAGETWSPAFPVLNGYPFTPSAPGERNGFLTRFNPAGGLFYSTLIKGSLADRCTAVALGSPGFAYVTGSTYSSDFLTVGGAFQTALKGTKDAFLTFVDTNSIGAASIPYSTYLGGSDSDEANAIAMDSFNHIFVAGETSSPDFPVTPATAFQPSLATAPDGFLCEVTVPAVGGYPFVSYASYLGGSGLDVIEALAVAGQMGVSVAGFTESTNFPQVTPLQAGFGGGSTDAFFSRFNTLATGSASLTCSTYFGGSGADFIYGLALDPSGNPLLAGTTASANFPVLDPLMNMGTYRGGSEDAFVARIVFPAARPETGLPPTLGMSTFLGGNGDDYAEGIASGPLGDVVVAGATNSTNFPVLAPLQSTNGGLYDAFVTKISLAASPCSVSCTAGVTPSSGPPAQPFTFSSTVTPSGCTGSPVYLWDFGDAKTSAFANPIHVYSSPGTFIWSLTVTVDTSTCVRTGSVTVTQCTLACTALASPVSGLAPLPVAFSATATPTGCTGAAAYDWDFGDGSAHGVTQNPSHTYTSPGSYAWTMTVTVNGVPCVQTGAVTVTQCTLACTALASPVSGLAPLPVAFSATATPAGCTGTSTYDWDFGDGSAHSNAQNPSHTYTSPGSYTWTMTVTVNGVPCVQTGSVTVTQCTLSCTASASPVSGLAPLPVTFSASAIPSGCTGMVTYGWDFGDGSPHGSGQTVVHTYGSPGQYSVLMTVSTGNVTCTRGAAIMVTPCALSCSASVSPGAGTTETVFTFDAATSSPNCPGLPAYEWDFGDGSPHGTAQNINHTYAAAGTYTWTLRATQGGVSCSKSGQVYVAQVQQGSLQGFVGICATSGFWPLAGSGVHDLKVTAANAQGQTTLAILSGAAYAFGMLPPGAYMVTAEMDYEDAITVPNDDLSNAGCAAPGVVLKHVRSTPLTIVISGTVPAVQNLCFPPPLVLLHGSLKCYQQWWDGTRSGGDTRYWDNMARSEGAITFTPNYHWWGAGASWGESVEQVLSQLTPDLRGLVGTLLLHPSPAPNSAASWPPYVIVAHDMGGLVARVLTSGRHRGEDIVQAITRIVLIGTPNSGSDTLFGGGRNRVMSTDVIINRFNLVYPDFGEKTGLVFAIGGTKDWWRVGNSDGRVTLYSAFTITRVACSPNAFGYPVCEPYAYLTFASEPEADHLFHYNHDGLTGGSPSAPTDSSTTILKNLILPALRLERGIASEAARIAAGNIAPDGDPESPAGQSIWGTTGRTSGSANGQIPGGLAPAQTRDYPFTIGDTDGMGVVIFVTQGSGLFEIFRPDGTRAGSATVTDEYLYTELAPPASTETTRWILHVTAGSGGVTFSAAFIEDGTFGTKGYATLDHYNPGDPVTLRVDLEGDRTGVIVSSVTAGISDLSDNPLTTVTLAQVGGPASGAYTGSWTLPPGAGGAYKVAFSTKGTFRAKRFERQSFTAVHATSPTPLFTGTFSDEPLDRTGDGLYDAVRFTAQVAFQRAGYYVMGADLYDADGAFLDHAATARDIAAAGTEAVDLTFDLRGTYCSQFDRPFQVWGLQLVDGATLNPLDVWNTIPTATYTSGTFQCLPGVPPPKIRAMRPDQGVQGQVLPFLVGGRGFKDGATLTFDSDITVGPVLWLSDSLLSTTLTIQPSAAPGPRSFTVTNPGGGADTLTGAFTVTVDQPPTVTLLIPSDGVRIKPGDPALRVSATASDDVRVSKVEFLLDATVAATDTEFPFTWDMPSSAVSAGSHTLTAKAYDNAGQTATSAITLIKEDPPVLSSIFGRGIPWILTINGSNFKAGLSVFIGADATPWPNLKLKSPTLLKVKGGRALKQRFPKGQAVAIRVRNPDGSEASGSYTR